MRRIVVSSALTRSFFFVTGQDSTRRTIFGPIRFYYKWLATNSTMLHVIPKEQSSIQAGVLRQNGGEEPTAQERVRNALDAHALQYKTVSIVIVTAPMHQLPNGAVLLVGHVWDRLHFVPSPLGSLT